MTRFISKYVELKVQLLTIKLSEHTLFEYVYLALITSKIGFLCFVVSCTMVEDELALFDKSINEFGNKFRNTLSDTPCQMLGLRDACKDSIKTLAGTYSQLVTCYFCILVVSQWYVS